MVWKILNKSALVKTHNTDSQSLMELLPHCG